MADYFMCVDGEIDLVTAPDLDHALQQAIRIATGDIVVDFSDVTFLDSSGLRVLIVAADALADRGRRLRLLSVRAAVRRPIEIAGLADRFDLRPPSH